MLELKKITKKYKTGNLVQLALNDVSIKFRNNEFVSILGPSGSGKTTLLNIIGGLDQYTSGDLIINEKSTKKFKDRDWDTYRNHRVGFVFQSYNLIPHQTALSNVELALTLSGISKEERRKRAKKALKDVGLEAHIHKKPNQMSGGQMQRIAIARALVNDPDILLADEPTGALDSKTSLQIMELLSKIAKDRLVVMVTHNPELADKYSSRIIKLSDGKVTDDSNPVKENDENRKEIHKKNKKTSMSFLTALSLSFNNLLTKKGRTILTSFAGSIGIIGIALILSISTGVSNYIDKVEKETLSSYPIMIEEKSVDTTSLLSSLMGTNKKVEHDKDKIYTNTIMKDMINTMTNEIQTNNLEEFKKYIDSSNMKDYTTDIQYIYNLDLQLFKKDTENEIVQVNPNKIYESMGIEGMMGLNTGYSMFSNYNNVFRELMNNKELLKNQYDLLAGSWPKKYNEVVLIVDDNNEISDYTLYALGLKDQNEIKDIMNKVMTGEEVVSEVNEYTYEDLLELSFKLVLNNQYYVKEKGIWKDNSKDNNYLKQLIDNGIDINVVGIIRPNEESITEEEYGSIGYTHDLTDYVINEINNSDIVKEQKANPNINIFTGKEFNNDVDINSLIDPTLYKNLSQEELVNYITELNESMKATYEDNLIKLGSVDIDKPFGINIYPSDFESKEEISKMIEEYNQDKIDNKQDDLVISYNDVVGMMLSSVTTIVDVISYVLIAFVSISLVVSSIMIGIITYISVLERTKEIGILRAMGASKKDISRVFNAETFIVGLIAGLFGIGITLLLNIPVNMIIKSITGISNIAKLPLNGAIILIIISMLLTIIAGLIPAKMASKKDPVIALEQNKRLYILYKRHIIMLFIHFR